MTGRISDLIARNVEKRADAPAIKDYDGQVYDWRSYAGLIDTAAALLRANGAAPGERVMIVGENCLAVPALIFAAAQVGAWAVPVNARMSSSELAQVTAHAKPALTLYTSHVSEEAKRHAGDAGPIDAGFGALQMHRDKRNPAPDPEIAVLLYTNQSTDGPMGVMLSHQNLLFAAKASAQLRGMTERDHIYGALPLTHVFGVASMMMAAAHAGAMVELVTRFDPARLFEALQKGATVMPAVPQMHALLMAHAKEHGHTKLRRSKLRYVSSGAAPLDPAWKKQAETFYGIALQNGYGMTESTSGISATGNRMGDPDTSVGPPLPGVEVALDYGLGADAQVGEVLTRGPHVMAGYFRNPEATAQAIKDGWLRTGDLGHIDDEGRLHIVGRAKELIIRGGFNVYPPEVEAALNSHPGVVQSAVIGRAANGDEEVLAFVQPRPGAGVTVTDLTDHVARRLTGHKRPTSIVLADTLPATATGQILKHKLLEVFGGRLC
ncbi:class I adenylate-forming enzyme family protein [Tropicibacter naphthalenivorans]|uniref:Long-chain-fatty-acid--CoA ligase n=1 Tax=Tropicibacter naphthalenivorans TaxID=441103 RepID=A0A0P1GK35_9RHOB|nr:AMP-binding protein [Tropicibacter naphthalenivorans]CUH82517.1 Long-chain-fatty-acid--CoA ligase [Tropicibacter naphthalenivorans]SMD06811.1 Acyl-CoA synthetase (AMP-forming)/AMP-acid ligase II [Tropicibacter naphthalenivorans]